MSEPYEIAVLRFFEGKPRELGLYNAFAEKVLELYPTSTIRVLKTQISFSNRYNFAFVSLPLRKVKGRPEHCIIMSFGLGSRLISPRIEQAVEPYPNRWTHHIIVSRESQLDAVLMGWISESYAFAESKR